jgi:hypothetical protein
MLTLNAMPEINWIKVDLSKHIYFEDGSRFLIAVFVENSRTRTKKWEFDIVSASCNDERLSLVYENGEPYDTWTWDDIDYFAVLEGKEPTSDIE